MAPFILDKFQCMALENTVFGLLPNCFPSYNFLFYTSFDTQNGADANKIQITVDAGATKVVTSLENEFEAAREVDASLNGTTGNGISSSGKEHDIETLEPEQISEENLNLKLQNASELLQNEDWEERIKGMQVCHDLLKYRLPNSFPKLILDLQDLVQKQILDRRSQVSRQACHLIRDLAWSLGMRLETFLLGMVETLFKAQTMSMQIVTESSDEACRAIVEFCPSPRLIPLLCACSRLDRNAKLRAASASYLAQAIEQWDAPIYTYHNQMIQITLLSIVADASYEVRRIARTAFLHYFKNNPSGFCEAIQKLGSDEQHLKKKILLEIIEEYGIGALIDAGIENLEDVDIDISSHVNANNHRVKGQALRISKPSLSSGGQSQVQNTKTNMMNKQTNKMTTRNAERVAVGRPKSLLSHGGLSREHNTTEMAVKLFNQRNAEAFKRANSVSSDGSQHSLQSQAARHVARRIPSSSQGSEKGSKSKTNLKANTVLLAPSNSYQDLHKQLASRSSSDQQSVPQIINKLRSQGTLWSSKVECFACLLERIENGKMPNFSNSGDLSVQLVQIIFDGIADTHHKVAAASLEVLIAMIQSSPSLFDAQMDKLISILLNRSTDSKEQIRHLTAVALFLIMESYPVETVTSGAEAGLRSLKSPKAICCALEFWADVVLNLDSIGTNSTLNLQKSPSYQANLASIMTKCLEFSLHRNIDIRNCALQSIAVSYVNGYTSSVRSAFCFLSEDKKENVRKGLASIMEVPSHSILTDVELGPNAKHSSRVQTNTEVRTGIRTKSPSQTSKTPGSSKRPRWRSPGSDSDDDNETNFSSPDTKHMLESLERKSPCSENVSPRKSASKYIESKSQRHEIQKILENLSQDPDEDSFSQASIYLSMSSDRDIIDKLTQAYSEGVIKVMQKLYEDGKRESSIISDIRLQETALEYYIALKSVFESEPASSILKKSALQLLKSLLKASNFGPRGKFSALMEQVTMSLTHVYHDSIDILSILINFLPSSESRPVFEYEKSWSTSMVLRMARNKISELEPSQTKVVLQMVMPALCICFESANPEIRKVSVDCLVAMYSKVGEQIWNYLEDFSDVQKRLIQICIDQSKE